jgi:hypothetical protein
LSRESGLDFVQTETEMPIEGIVRRRVDLAPGRFAMIDNSGEFALVPWRPVLARAIGRAVSGHMRKDGGISWTIGRGRGPEGLNGSDHMRQMISRALNKFNKRSISVSY